MREVQPRQGFAIHDAMLSDKGLAGLTNWLALAGKPAGTPLDRLEPGSSVDLSLVPVLNERGASKRHPAARSTIKA